MADAASSLRLCVSAVNQRSFGGGAALAAGPLGRAPAGGVGGCTPRGGGARVRGGRGVRPQGGS
jgi:hypothetical protein